MDFAPKPKPTTSATTIHTILTHPKEFSQLCKQSTPGIKVPQKPEQVKVHLNPDEVRCFGDGSTFGAIKALFWNLVTLLIDFTRCDGNFFGEENTALKGHIEDGEKRAECIAKAGIDDFNGADQLNWLHRLPSGEVEELISVVSELKKSPSQHPELNFNEGNEEVILYSLEVKTGNSSCEVAANLEGIWFRQAGIENQDPIKIMSFQDYRNIQILDEIKRGLTPRARMTLQPYLTLQDIGHDVGKTSPIVVGDMGGGTALMVLMGIQAGKIDITKDGIRYLVTVLNAEAKIASDIKNARTEETAETIRTLIGKSESHKQALEALKSLEKCLAYKPSDIPLIFSSDTVSGIPIRQKLKDVGVMFIPGPDDLKSVEANKEEQSEACTNAHYDKSTNTLYLNGGLRMASGASGAIRTAVGTFRPDDSTKFSPEKFVEWMNTQDLPEDASSFRPMIKAIEEAAEKLGVRIVIADEKRVSEHANVIVLGSLNSRHAQPVLAARIGHANPRIG